MKFAEKYQKQIRLGVLFLIMWMDVVGVSLFYPIAWRIVGQFTPGAMMVSMLTVLYSAAQFIAAPILGKLSDRWGRRPMLLASLAGSSVGYVLFGLAGALWLLLLARVVGGLSGGNISIASAAIADLSAPEERPKNFALVGLAWGVGLVVGPAIGTALVGISLWAPAFFAAALMAATAVLCWFFLPESLPVEKREPGKLTFTGLNPFSAIWRMARKPGVGRLLLVGCLYNLAVGGTNNIASLFMVDRFKATQGQIGLYITLVGVGVALIQLAVPPVVRRLGERRTAVLTLFEQAVGGVAIFFCRWLLVFFPVALVSGWLGNFLFAPLTAMQTSLVEEADTGTLMGVTTSLNGLMNIFGPLWAGFVFDAVAPGATYLTAAGLFVAAAGVMLGGPVLRRITKGPAL